MHILGSVRGKKRTFMSYFQWNILKKSQLGLFIGRFFGSNFMLCSCLFKSVGIDWRERRGVVSKSVK